MSLPIASPERRRLPLAEAREKDARYRPRIAVWELTLRCDLACRHCGSRAGHARHDELTREECLRVVSELAELGVMEVSLIGGEAYLHPAFLEVVAALHARGIEVAMATGGRGITDELAQAARQAGLASASISIDGLEATHDELRGLQGSYRAAFAALERLTRAGVWVGVNSQINRKNAGELAALLEAVIAAGGRAWQIALTVPMGRAADRPEILLQPYELLELFPELARLKQRCDEAGVRLWPGNNIGYFGPYESVLRGTTPRGHSIGCGAGCNSLGIEADGGVKGCPSLPSDRFVGGSLREHPIATIWERSEPLRYIRDRTLDDLWGFCRECYYADTCRAGCTWTAHVLFGRPGNNPYCHHRALEMQQQGRRERLVQVAAAPGNPFDYGRFELVVEALSEDGASS